MNKQLDRCVNKKSKKSSISICEASSSVVSMTHCIMGHWREIEGTLNFAVPCGYFTVRFVADENSTTIYILYAMSRS